MGIRLNSLALAGVVGFLGNAMAGHVVVADPSAYSGTDVSNVYSGLSLRRIDVIGEVIDTTVTMPIAQSSPTTYPVFSDGLYFTHTGSTSLLVYGRGASC
jgi:hypothetical protein